MNNDWREYTGDQDYLEHHGILGQKWGVRRFENKNGALTAAGKKRYNSVDGEYQKIKKKVTPSKVDSTGEKKKEDSAEPEKKKGLTDKQKKMIIAGAAVVGTAVAAYGGYKLYQLNKQATEGLSNDYHKKATVKFTEANKLFAESEGNHSLGFKTYNNDLIKKSVEQNYKGHEKRAEAEALQDLAKSKKYSIGEKANYLKEQRNSKLSSQKDVEKTQQKYIRDKYDWNQKTRKLNYDKAVAERQGNTAKANRIDKKLASSPPPLPPSASKSGVTATNKLASEASALARSVTAEGPKSFSKPAQNTSQTRSQSTPNKVKIETTRQTYDLSKSKPQQTVNTGRKSVTNTTKIHGQEKFSAASKANDDLVQELLKKNTIKF